MSEAISNQIMVYIVMSFFWAVQAVKYLRDNQFFGATICKLNSSQCRRNKSSPRYFVALFSRLRRSFVFLKDEQKKKTWDKSRSHAAELDEEYFSIHFMATSKSVLSLVVRIWRCTGSCCCNP